MKPEEPPFILIDPKPASLELWVRAVCGASFGVVLATIVWLKVGGFSEVETVVLYVTGIVGSAFFAAKYGDRYWNELSSFLRWPHR